MSDDLIKLLGKEFYRYDSYSKSNPGITITTRHEYIDGIFNLIRTCRTIKKIFLFKLLRIVEFDISILSRLSDEHKKYLRYLFIDETECAINQQLYLISLIPSNVVGLRFSGDNINLQNVFNYSSAAAKKKILPNNLTKLTFGYIFDTQLTKNMMPDKLTYLDVGDTFNQLLSDNIFPDTLTHLIFGAAYDKPIYGMDFDNMKVTSLLPDTLTCLKFGLKFNQELYVIDANHDITNLLPKNLTTLRIGSHFDQHIIENVLPKSLTRLNFHGVLYSKRNKNQLTFAPDNVFTHKILPDNLTCLKFDGQVAQSYLPVGFFPANLTYLYLGYYFNIRLEVDMLPNSLRTLKFHTYNLPLEPCVLPKHLTFLEFWCKFNQPLPQGVLPDSLEYLILPSCFRQSYKNIVLPKKIKNYIKLL